MQNTDGVKVRTQRDGVESLLEGQSITNHSKAAILVSIQKGTAYEVTTPKMPEPSALGTIVEDADGARFIRVTKDDGEDWYQTDRRDGNWIDWSQIEAVRVVHNGYEEKK